MGQGKISVGVDTLTGEPSNAPKGPYITDDNAGTQPPSGSPLRDKALLKQNIRLNKITKLINLTNSRDFVGQEVRIRACLPLPG